MSAPEPRVRVCKSPWATIATSWHAHCPYCAHRGGFVWRYTWSAAFADAIEHVIEEPCDGLRLAWLVHELEALRDRHEGHRDYYRAHAATFTSPSTARAFSARAAGHAEAALDLTALLGRMG